MNKTTQHSYFHFVALADRATDERISYYCRAIEAASIGNGGAARYFTTRAQRWEAVRVASITHMLALDNSRAVLAKSSG